MDQPTEEERLEFVKSYGVEPVTDINTDLTFKDAAKTVAEMTPIIGDAMAAKEIYDELQKEDPDYRFVAVLGGAALVGAVPGIGDVAAKGIRNAADMIKRIEVDPDALGMMGGNIRIKPKKSESFKLDDMYRDDFDWGKLNLKDSEVAELANVQKSYLEAGGGAKAVEAAEKKVQDNIESRIPAITEALKYKLKTSDKGVVSLDDYKDAVEATVRFDTVEEAAESISDQKAILNKMGPSMMDDMLYDDKISGAFEQLPDNETFQYILENGLDRSLVDWAVKEEAIRKSFNNYKKAANKSAAPTDVWSYPEQLYDSADTSINVSKKPAGYNELKKRGEIKDGDVIVDIGGGRFDNLVEDAAEEGATVKVYDPFNRTPEHNAAVVDSVKDGQADMAMSHNVLNVIQEDKNIIDIAVQAENAIKPNGKAHFSVYEGTGKGEGKITTKGYQRNEKTQAYVPLIEQVFGEGNVTRKGKIITATKNAQGFSEGGMALEEQMNMNFGDVPDNTIGIDPVSGNEIPMGSTAENVRDDIPANLSEGEIVVAADVVNFHGVKLFEDLRAEAKMGYQEMSQDGRMGGEPMNDDMGMDIELSELDLEVMDDEAPVQMNRGGRSMADYKDVAKNRDIKTPKRTAPRKTHAEIMASAFSNDDKKDNSPAAISARVQARKDKPKNRFEAIRNRLRDVFDGDDEPDRQSRFDFGFSGNPMERAARKYGSPASATKNESLRAGQVASTYTGGQEPVNNSVRYYDQPFYKRLMEGLGFDEGGMATQELSLPTPVEDTNLIGGEAQFNQPFYDPDQKGGFDMENAYVDQVEGGTGGPVLEMREYMNDEGHRIFITFIDGVAQMEIPAGYYPVGEGVAVAPTPAIGGSGGSDSGGGMDMPTPDPVNYKELSLEELTEMVNSQGDLKGDVIASGLGLLNPLMGAAVKFAMWNQTRQVKREIERRLTSNETSNVDKMRYQNLLEITERETPTLLDKILGRDFEKTVGQIPKPVTPDTDFADPTMAGGQPYNPGAGSVYTPNDQTASQTTTPGVDDGLSNELKTQIEQASADAASAAFGSPSKTVKPVGNDDFIEAVKQDPDSFLPPTSANDNNDSPISRPPTPAAKPSPIYDNVAAGDYDDDSTGVYKGGMMRKKKKKKSK